MIDFERDINLAKSGKESLIYKTLIGLKTDLSKPAEIPEILAAKQDKNDDNDTEEDSNDGDSSRDDSEDGENSESNSDEEDDKNDDNKKENTSKSINTVRCKDESPESRKVRSLILFPIYVQLIILIHVY